MITKYYLQGSIEANPFPPLKILMFPTRAWELTQIKWGYLIPPFLENLLSLERPWSQPKSPSNQQRLCAHCFEGNKRDRRRTKKCLFKLTLYINLEIASLYSSQPRVDPKVNNWESQSKHMGWISEGDPALGRAWGQWNTLRLKSSLFLDFIPDSTRASPGYWRGALPIRRQCLQNQWRTEEGQLQIWNKKHLVRPFPAWSCRASVAPWTPVFARLMSCSAQTDTTAPRSPESLLCKLSLQPNRKIQFIAFFLIVLFLVPSDFFFLLQDDLV